MARSLLNCLNITAMHAGTTTIQTLSPTRFHALGACDDGSRVHSISMHRPGQGMEKFAYPRHGCKAREFLVGMEVEKNAKIFGCLVGVA